MESAGDKRADKIEGKHEHAVGQIGVQQAGGVSQSEVRGNAGVREDVDVFAPVEFSPEQIHALEWRAVGQVAGIVAADESIETADPEVAAGDDDGRTRRAPSGCWDAGGELAQAGHPARRKRLVHRPPQGERPRGGGGPGPPAPGGGGGGGPPPPGPGAGFNSGARRPASNAATVAGASPN